MSPKVLRYDFKPQPILDKKGELEIVYKATVPVKLGNPKAHKIGPTPVSCLVDSGSDMNLLPASWGTTVGLKIKKGIEQKILGIGGNKLIGYKHRINLHFEKHTIKNVWGIFCFNHYIPLLGRIGFFDEFKKVVFNEKYVRLELYL